jgi:hypothetical protein
MYMRRAVAAIGFAALLTSYANRAEAVEANDSVATLLSKARDKWTADPVGACRLVRAAFEVQSIAETAEAMGKCDSHEQHFQIAKQRFELALRLAAQADPTLTRQITEDLSELGRAAPHLKIEVTQPQTFVRAARFYLDSAPDELTPDDEIIDPGSHRLYARTEQGGVFSTTTVEVPPGPSQLLRVVIPDLPSDLPVRTTALEAQHRRDAAVLEIDQQRPRDAVVDATQALELLDRLPAAFLPPDFRADLLDIRGRAALFVARSESERLRRGAPNRPRVFCAPLISCPDCADDVARWRELASCYASGGALLLARDVLAQKGATASSNDRRQELAADWVDTDSRIARLRFRFVSPLAEESVSMLFDGVAIAGEQVVEMDPGRHIVSISSKAASFSFAVDAAEREKRDFQVPTPAFLAPSVSLQGRAGWNLVGGDTNVSELSPEVGGMIYVRWPFTIGSLLIAWGAGASYEYRERRQITFDVPGAPELSRKVPEHQVAVVVSPLVARTFAWHRRLLFQLEPLSSALRWIAGSDAAVSLAWQPSAATGFRVDKTWFVVGARVEPWATVESVNDYRFNLVGSPGLYSRSLAEPSLQLFAGMELGL